MHLLRASFLGPNCRGVLSEITDLERVLLNRREVFFGFICRMLSEKTKAVSNYRPSTDTFDPSLISVSLKTHND